MPNTNEFTQKDLMQHLLNASHHAATREDIADLRVELKQDISELRTEVKDLRVELKQDIVDVRTELSLKIDNVDKKFDRLTWLVVTTLAAVLVSIVVPVLTN